MLPGSDLIQALQQARREGFECALSLCRAIHEAGGSIPAYEELAATTLDDFITKVAAQNGIRFAFKPATREPKRQRKTASG